MPYVLNGDTAQAQALPPQGFPPNSVGNDSLMNLPPFCVLVPHCFGDFHGCQQPIGLQFLPVTSTNGTLPFTTSVRPWGNHNGEDSLAVMSAGYQQQASAVADATRLDFLSSTTINAQPPSAMGHHHSTFAPWNVSLADDRFFSPHVTEPLPHSVSTSGMTSELRFCNWIHQKESPAQQHQHCMYHCVSLPGTQPQMKVETRQWATPTVVSFTTVTSDQTRTPNHVLLEPPHGTSDSVPREPFDVRFSSSKQKRSRRSVALPPGQTECFHLIVHYVAPEITDNRLRQLFQRYEGFVAAKMLVHPTTGLSRGIGFVWYETQAQAMQVIDKASGRVLLGKRIRITFALPQQPPPSAQELTLQST